MTLDNGTLDLRETYTSVRDVLRRMAAMALRDRSAVAVREVTTRITRGHDVLDSHEVARSIWRYLRRRVRWVPDAAATELLQTPTQTLDTGYGDCDCIATLAAAMLESVGIDAGLEAIAYDEPGEYDHVYAVYRPGETWHPLDPTSETAPGPTARRPPAHDRLLLPLSTIDQELTAMSRPHRRAMALARMNDPARRNGRYGSYGPTGFAALGQSNTQVDGSEDSGSAPSIDSWEEALAYALNVAPEYIRAFREQGRPPQGGEYYSQQPPGSGFTTQQAGFWSGTAGQLIIGGTVLGVGGLAIYSIVTAME